MVLTKLRWEFLVKVYVIQMSNPYILYTELGHIFSIKNE